MEDTEIAYNLKSKEFIERIERKKLNDSVENFSTMEEVLQEEELDMDSSQYVKGNLVDSDLSQDLFADVSTFGSNETSASDLNTSRKTHYPEITQNCCVKIECVPLSITPMMNNKLAQNTSSFDHTDCVSLKKIKSDERKLKCSLCPKMFTSRKYLKRHRARHENKKKFKCDLCPKMFTLQEYLQKHISRFVNKGVHRCHSCPKIFISKECVKKHAERHENKNESELKSDLCPKTFISKEFLMKHMAKNGYKIAFICSCCPKMFTSREYLNEHMASHESEDEEGYKCHLCPKMFISRKYLKKHMKIHEN